MPVMNEEEIEEAGLKIFIKKEDKLRYVAFPHSVNVESGELSYWVPRPPKVDSESVLPIDTSTPEPVDITMDLISVVENLVVVEPSGAVTSTEEFNSKNSYG
jgi:hypothetical protein